MGPCQAKKGLYSKGHGHSSKSVAYRMEIKKILYASQRELVSILHKELNNLNIKTTKKKKTTTTHPN